MSFSPLSKLGIIQNLNYITNSDFNNFPFASNATLGWSLKNGGTPDATTKLPTSAPSAAAAGTLTLTAVTGGSQISGTVSASLSSTAATTAGDMMITDALTLDLKVQSTIQTFSFSYKVSANGTGTPNFSGTSSNAIGVAIYDVTNSAWIQPAGVFNLVQSSGVGRSTGTFQVPSNCTSVRLAVYFPNSTAASAGSPFTVILDDFVLGPQTSPTGAAVSDWQSYTPTGSWSGVAYTGQWRRIGDSAEIQVTVKVTNSALISGNLNNISYPSGITADTAKLGVFSTGGTTRGIVQFSDATGAGGYLGTNSIGVSAIAPLVLDTGAGGTGEYPFVNSITASAPVVIANNDEIKIKFDIPVSGWSSNTVMSQDTDTRLVAASFSVTGSHTSSGSFQAIPSLTVRGDTHGMISGTTLTIPVSGWYDFSGNIGFASNATGIRDVQIAFSPTPSGVPFSPTTQFSSPQVALSGGQTHVGVGGAIYINAGTQITFNAYQNSGGSLAYGDTLLTIKRLSGPATIAASETVALQRYAVSGQTINSSVPSIIDFPTSNISGATKIDTHNSWRSASGVYNAATGTWSVTNPGFVAPVSGTYQVSGSIGWSVATFGTASAYCVISVNGTAVFSSNDNINSVAGAIKVSAYSGLVKLNAGDVVQVYANQDTGTAKSLQVYTLDRTSFNIIRVGN